MFKKALFATLSLVLLLSIRSVGSADAAAGYLSVDFVCAPAGGVDALLVWSSSGGALQQWVDISLVNNDWDMGTFGALQAGPTAQSLVASGLMPSTAYFVRINQRYAGGWDTSPTFVFRTPANCARLLAKASTTVSVTTTQDSSGGSGSSARPGTTGGGGGLSITPPPDNCHPNYYGACLNKDAVDYDCEGGGGDGPSFVKGPVYITGSDPFELDSDGDGIGCNE